MSSELRAQQEMLRQLTRTDPDPRVRGRAHALLLLTLDHSVVAVARLFATAPHRVRVWRSRFLAGGRQGLADEPRTGRPPKLDPAALAFLREVLAARLGIRVCTATVHRAVHRLAYHYRRPRHDLTHRQDAEAVAAAQEVLAWLRKKAVTPPANCGWSTSTSARFTVIPAWQESGNGVGVR
jgi:transposase